ncbi:MAG TPA: class I SAM-dependent methyltransferase [Solirubrobacterales bacterium]|nr:class I SAM-dependent methyltransferase [Solirubrobacterales bacterium]
MADYGTDLAYVHDAGFLDLARQAAPFVVERLAERGMDEARVVELGCGSGETAAELGVAGHEVLGVDASRAMVELARHRAPEARFRVGTWTTEKIPECECVIAIGEVLGYVGAAKGTKAELRDLFGRVRTALTSGGLFVFDLATPGRVPAGEDSAFRVGEDWAILYTAQEDSKGRKLQRRITTFRKIAGGATYRRTEEVHRLRLWRPGEIEAMLRDARFKVQTRRGYGPRSFAPGHRVFVARA